MGRIPDEIIQQIRDRVDIVDLIGRHLTLKRSGRNHKGLCPFHHEKTPSFNVNSDRQTFYCFGCQEGGNAITFLMRVENLTFPEAVRALGRECGIDVPEEHAGARGEAELLFRANEIAHDCYRRELAVAGNPGAAYLEKRDLDAENVERFGAGYAPDAWDTLVRELGSKGVSAEVGERAGLLMPRRSGGHYDRLRDRVIFPIRDVRGRVVGFGGRVLSPDQEPKYLNTPESPIYRKRESFFGLPEALEPIRRHGRAVLVEGYFDLVALSRAGVEGTLATCGTALTADHARQLRRRTRQVVLLFDGDEAGQNAMERGLEVLLPEGLRVRAAALPPGDDPDDFLAREGAEALAALVDEATPALSFAIRRAVARGNQTPWEKADAVASVAPLLALVADGVERAEFQSQLALAVGVETPHVAAAVRAAVEGTDPREAVPVEPRRSPLMDRKLRLVARCLVEHPGLARLVPREELPALVGDPRFTALIGALVDGADRGGSLDVEALGQDLAPEERALLHELAMDDHGLEEEAARRALEDTLGSMRRERDRERQRELTKRLREDPGADPAALLKEKDSQRQSAAEVVSDPPTGVSP